MRLSLPANFADLTLGMLQVLETSEDPLERVSAVAGVAKKELRDYPRPLITEALAHIERLRARETSRHLETFDLQGVTYGFIPNWDEFTTGEWIDAEQYAADFWKNAHKLMALLFRPIVRKWGDAYEIEPYTAKENAEVFKDLPADQVSGALLFFFDYKNRTAEHFAVLFNSDGSGSDEFSQKWGWYPVLYGLAGEDILRFESVTRLTVGHVFSHLAFLKDLEFKRKQNRQ